jgi:molybdopterin-guanine dinucleotide biosynthesis protein A
VPGRERPPGAAFFGREVTDAAEEGPLRGVLTALENCTTAELCVIPVDMPSMGRGHLAALLGELRSRPGALGVMFQRKMRERAELEPLPLACRREAADGIAEQLRAGDRSLRGVVSRAGFVAVDAPHEWPESTWRNLNTPGDL